MIERLDDFELNFQHFAFSRVQLAMLGHSAGGVQVTDSTQYGRHAAVINASLTAAWQRWLSRWSFEADGTDDYLDFGNILNDVWTADSFFVSCWVYRTAAVTVWLLNKIGDTSVTPTENQRQWRFGIVGTGEVDYGWYGSLVANSYRIHRTVDTLNVGRWHHIAAQYDASAAANDRITIFIDGRPAPTGLAFSAGSPLAIQSGTARLGCFAFLGSAGVTPGFYGSARIADLIVCRGVLPPSFAASLADPTDVMLNGLLVNKVVQHGVFFPASLSGWKLWYASQPTIIGEGLI